MKLELQKKAHDIKRNYEVMIKASVAALKAIDKLPKEPEKLPEAFKKYLIDSGLVAPWYSDVFGKVVEMRKLLEEKKLDKIPDRDIYMSKEYVRRFIMDVRRVIERKKAAKVKLPPVPPEPAEKVMSEAKAAVETAKEIEKAPPAEVGVCLPADKRVKKIEKKLKKERKKCKK